MCLSSAFPGNDKVARITSMGFLPCLTHQCWSQLLSRIAKGSGPWVQMLLLLQVLVGSTLPCLARDNIGITVQLGSALQFMLEMFYLHPLLYCKVCAGWSVAYNSAFNQPEKKKARLCNLHHDPWCLGLLTQKNLLVAICSSRNGDFLTSSCHTWQSGTCLHIWEQSLKAVEDSDCFKNQRA